MKNKTKKHSEICDPRCDFSTFPQITELILCCNLTIFKLIIICSWLNERSSLSCYILSQGKTTRTTSESEGGDATDVSSRLYGISLRDEKTSGEGASQTVETTDDKGTCQTVEGASQMVEAELNEDSVERTDDACDTDDNVVHIEIVGTDEEKQETDALAGQLGEGDILPAGSLQESESEDYDDSDDDDSDDDDSDDDDGWITPSNICSVKQSMGEYESGGEAEMVEVGCLTTDFAMQVSHESRILLHFFDDALAR